MLWFISEDTTNFRLRVNISLFIKKLIIEKFWRLYTTNRALSN